jgi:hypothetical protein
LTRYPVFTLAAVSLIGCILALGVLLRGFVWLSILIFAVTTVVLCSLLAIWIGRPAK